MIRHHHRQSYRFDFQFGSASAFIIIVISPIISIASAVDPDDYITTTPQQQQQ